MIDTGSLRPSTMRGSVALVALVFGMLAFPAMAQPAVGNDAEDQTLASGTIVVTASRVEQDITDTPASIEVVTRAELEATPAFDLTDILKKNASVDVIQYPGGLAGIGLRGFRPEFSGTTRRVLILVNGRPAGAESNGNIAAAGLDRVEVLKGSASAIYGASAMGGVVNYITRETTGPLQMQGSFGYGSYDTVRSRASIGGSLDEVFSFDLAGLYIVQNDDFQLGDGGETIDGFVQGNGAVRPNTRFSNGNIYARLAADLGDWQARGRLHFYDAPNTETPGAESDGIANQSDKDESNIGGDISVLGSVGNHELLALAYRTKEKQAYLDKPPSTQPFIDSTNTIKWSGLQLQDNWTITPALGLILGADYQLIDETASSFNAAGTLIGSFSPDYNRETIGAYADATVRIFDKRLILSAGLRYDEIKTRTLATLGRARNFEPGQSSFDVWNPRVGFVFRPTLDSPFRLHGTYGTGFVVPDPSQISGLFEQVVAGQRRLTQGNADLSPESSDSYDVGIGFDGRFAALDLTLFKLDVEDRIVTVLTTNTPALRVTSYENADSSTAEGVEAQGRFDLGGLLGGTPNVFQADFSLTHYFARREELSTGPSTIRNVAKTKINFGAGYDDGTYSLRAGGRHVAGAEDRDFSARRIFTGGAGGQFVYPSFVVYDLVAGYDFDANHGLLAKIDNLTNEYYFEKSDYPFRGRNFQIEYRFRF